MKTHIVRLGISTLLLALVAACSIAPDNPVTREELMRTQMFKRYVIDESPEQILNALNTQGEVILEGKRQVPGGKTAPVYIKVLATSLGLEVSDYER
jgi:hypothetical protein